MRLKVLICLTLAFVTFGLYWPARHFTFLYYDDQLFLLNPHVARGLGLFGVLWAFTAVVASNWHPITTFSFLVTHQFFGLDPGAEHLLNGAFHAVNAAMLFIVLTQMTGATWRSAIVAAIFAWHPLRVESVAWIAERKDVLFMFFVLLSLLCYTRYTRAGPGKPLPPPDERTIFDIPPRTAYYYLALSSFALSFLSKATVVTLPLLLLLIDFWPLRRFDRDSAHGLLTEKAPFFALALLFCVITFWAHKAHADVESLANFSLGSRIQNAILSYENYLGKLVWPTNLVILYPYPQSFNIAQVLLASALLLAISAICILQITPRPYLAVGWFWYLIAMLPVIGLVQIGLQAMADRHTYLALIGPTFSVVWLISEWARTRSFRQCVAGSAAVLVLAICAILTERQLGYWHDGATLFEHACSETSKNGAAEFEMAVGFEQIGDYRHASVHYRIAALLPPSDTQFTANFYLAELLAKMGYPKAAAARLEMALQFQPNSTDALNNLAWLLSTSPDLQVRDGRHAVQLAEHACQLTHDGSPVYLTTLAAAYAEVGRFDDAIATIQKAGELAQLHGQVQLFNGDARMLQQFTDQKPYTDTTAAVPKHP